MDLAEFIDVIGYESLYKINKNGEVYGVKRNNILKQKININGYYYIGLHKSNKLKFYKIHRLIGLHFIPNDDENKTQVDHIDGDRTNNNIENLRWVTSSNNMRNQISKTNYMYEYIKNDGTIRFQSVYPIYIDGKHIQKKKSSIHRNVVEEWIEQMKKEYPNEYIAGRIT